MFRSDGVHLCTVVFAVHPSAPAEHALRSAIESVDAEVVADHGPLISRRLGTGVLACFPSATAGLAAAQALQQRALLHHPEHPPAIGVSTGELLIADDDNMGMTTIVAARLSAVATGGQTLATHLSLLFADAMADDTVSLHDLVLHDLKGVPEPVPAAEVLWQPLPTVAAALGIPPALHTGDETFAGRHDELHAVLARLQRLADDGSGDVVVLSGEPGAGKSALLTHVARDAAALGLPVLYGRCAENAARPYAPIADMLRRVVQRDPRGSLALGRQAGELTRVVPEARERFPHLPAPLASDADTERMLLLDAFGGWLRAAGEEHTVLVVDDAHWADPGTVTVLAEACALAPSCGMLVIVATRPTSGATGNLVVDLRRAGALELRLHGLGADDIVELLPPDTDPALAERIHQRSNGNPFFVRELLRSLDDADGPAADDSVRQVVLRRISGLSDATRALLAAASVMGLSFDALLLVDVGAADAATFVDLLDEAVAAGVVVERVEGLNIAHEFVHALTRDALYEEMSTLRRARTHQQIARALEERGAPAEVLAHHFRAAAVVGESARAVQYTLAAADAALATFANEQALDGYRLAAELLAAIPDSTAEQRIDVDTRIGECLRRLGQPDYLEVLFAAAAAAAERNDGQRMAAALMASYRGSFHQAFAVHHELIALLERALELVDDERSSTRALLLARLAVELAWSERLDRAREHSDEAVRLAEALSHADGNDIALAKVLILRQWTLFDSLEDRLEWQRRTNEIVRRANDPALLLEAIDTEYFNVERSGEGAGAEERLREAEALATRLDSPMVWWNVTRIATTHAARVGDLPSRLAGIERAFEMGAAALQPDAGLRRVGEMFWVDFEHGEVEAQRATMAAIWRRAQLTPFGTGIAVAHRCLELGMVDEAREVYDSHRGLLSNPLQHQTWLCVQSQLAYVAVGLGELEDALVAETALVPHRDRIANIWFTSVGAVARYLGRVRLLDGDLDGAITELEHACAVNARAHAPGWRARTSLDLAGALRQRGAVDDAPRADGLVAEAAQVAATHRYPLIAHRAAQMSSLA